MTLEDHPDQELDASGLQCPLPLLKTKLALKALAVGQILLVKTTDSASLDDIPRFIARSDCELVSKDQVEGVGILMIRKG